MVTAMEVVPETYSETVSIAKVPATTQDDNLGLRLYVGPGPKHCRRTVVLEPTQVPVSYQDSLIVYIDSSKKRYISKTFYDNRLRPTQFGETHIQRELCTEESYIATVDHKSKDNRKWFKSAVNLVPKTYSNKVDLLVDDGTFQNQNGLQNGPQNIPNDLDDLENEVKVTGGVKVTSKNTRLQEFREMMRKSSEKSKTYKTGPLIVDTSEHKTVNNNNDSQENAYKYTNGMSNGGLNGNIYDYDDEDIDNIQNGHIYDDDDDYIHNNNIYETNQMNGWHTKESNGW